MNLPISRIILFAALIQFIRIASFMVVMPLGPDLVRALAMEAHQVGWIGGSYTLAAAVTGLLSAQFLDRFDRRAATLFVLLGLGGALAGAALAQEFVQLLTAYLIAGAFGGLATALSLAMVMDAVPVLHRGRAMGKVMGAFSAAAVIAVPVALELAHRISWQAPFWAMAGLSGVIGVGVRLGLPPLRDHIKVDFPVTSLKSLLSDPCAQFAYLSMAVTTLAVFLLVPHASTFFQFNLDFPRDKISYLYFAGGIASFFFMRWGGGLCDRIGVIWVSLGASAMMAGAIYGLFLYPSPTETLVIGLFAGFMVASSLRFVVIGTASAAVPRPHERAGFSAVNTAVQQLSCSVGAFLGAAWLTTREDGQLQGMIELAMWAIGLTLCLPGGLWGLQWALRRFRGAEESASTSPEVQ